MGQSSPSAGLICINDEAAAAAAPLSLMANELAQKVPHTSIFQIYVYMYVEMGSCSVFSGCIRVATIVAIIALKHLRAAAGNQRDFVASCAAAVERLSC